MKTAFPHAKLAWLASELQVYSKPYFLSFFKAGTVVCVKSLFILDWRRAGTASAVVKTVKREPFNVASREAAPWGVRTAPRAGETPRSGPFRQKETKQMRQAWHVCPWLVTVTGACE